MTARPTRQSQHRGSGSPARRAPRRGRIPLLLAVFAGLVLAAFIALGVGAGVVVAVARRDLPDVTRVYSPPSQATRSYAANGELIASLFRENRVTITLDQIPRHVRRAVLAIEDARFYQHRGVDFIGITRAMWHNLQSGELVEGGSTITQQLARQLFLTQERILSRKLTEMALALEIERRLTKDEILERYLNEIYFGQGSYGIEMASRVHFGKSTSKLTLAEGAMLAGVIRAPSIYTPYRNMGRARARQALVLGRVRGQERNLRLSQGALVVLDPRTGQIKAMIGGYDFAQSQFNRAWQARRQPGSAFKPFIYVTALATGVTADRILDDAPVTYEIRGSKPWKPKNYDGKFRGPILVRQAGEQSVNVPAAKTIAELGPDRVVEVAKRMGISSPLQPHLSLALGTADVTPLEMAPAFCVLADLGARGPPTAVRQIGTGDGA